MEAEELHEVTERLERAEDDLLSLIERYPHLLKEPQTLQIIHVMKTTIRELQSATRRLSA